MVHRLAREGRSVQRDDLKLRTRLGDCETVVRHELGKLDKSEKELCDNLLGVPHSPATQGTPQVSSGAEETDTGSSPTRPRIREPVPPHRRDRVFTRQDQRQSMVRPDHENRKLMASAPSTLTTPQRPTAPPKPRTNLKVKAAAIREETPTEDIYINAEPFIGVPLA